MSTITQLDCALSNLSPALHVSPGSKMVMRKFMPQHGRGALHTCERAQPRYETKLAPADSIEQSTSSFGGPRSATELNRYLVLTGRIELRVSRSTTERP